MSLTKSSIQVELDRFFKSLTKSPDSFETISKSAFTQSRKKLLPSAFIELTDLQLAFFQDKAPHKKSWKNHRLVAIDGSTLNLPNGDELEKHFGHVNNQFDQIKQARCSFAYDVCNELVLDACITKIRSGEKELAVAHLSKLNPENDVLIFDRGYPALWLMGLLQEKGFKFCFRLSKSWKDAVNISESEENDIDWTCKKRSKDGLSHPKNFQIPTQVDGMRLISIELSSGEKEVLATNLLDRNQFDISTMKELYNLRWGVEEAFKSFKKAVHIEYFTGKTVRSIEQEFFSKIFMLNMASMIRTQYIDHQKSRSEFSKHKQKANKTQVLAKTKDFLLDLFYSEDIRCLLNQMKKMLGKCFDIIRPNRSFNRQDVSKRRRQKSRNYKGI